MNDSVDYWIGVHGRAEKRLQELIPCPRCCPPKRPCSPGEYSPWPGELRVCKKCDGRGWWYDWNPEWEDE